MFKFRILRRYDISRRLKILIYLSSFAVGVFAFTLLEVAYGADPYDVMNKLFIKPLISYTDFQITIRYAVPIGIISLGLTLAYKAGIYSIGAEGQMAIGAIFAAWVAYTLGYLESPLSIVLALLVGLVGGLIWGLIPGILKGLLNVNEVLTTLMLNFIAYSLTDYLIYGPWRSPKAYGFPLTEPIPQAYVIPSYEGIPIINVLIMLFSVIFVHVVIKKSVFGYQIRAYGLNPTAANSAGISFFKIALLCLALSGAFAGLAGSLQLLSVHNRLGPKSWSVSEGLGYTAIVSAWLARLEPWAILPSAILLGALINGGLTIKAVLGQPEGIVNIMNGVILLSIIAAEFFINYKFIIRVRK
ncbi:MAG: ABC transporter permease [Sulfolobales archaeon]